MRSLEETGGAQLDLSRGAQLDMSRGGGLSDPVSVRSRICLEVCSWICLEETVFPPLSRDALSDPVSR